MSQAQRSTAVAVTKSGKTGLKGLVLLAALTLPGMACAQAQPVIYDALFEEHCSVCHGSELQGAAQGTPLVGTELRHGSAIDELARSISEGMTQTGMPAWKQTLDAEQIRQLAIYISERRANLVYTDFRIATPLEIPQGVIASEEHDFRIETVATGIDALPFSIAPLADGSILLTEKTRGLRIITPDGSLSEPLAAAPVAYSDGFKVPGILLFFGLGWMMDVALHPDYAQNGWIYLLYGDRCSDCNEISRASKAPVSMNTLVRGRIRDGKWVDQETIWKADIATYTPMPDMAAGGRIAFDGKGHVYFSVGLKGGGEQFGIQDLSKPYGKIHRVNDDGSIPADNPFVNTEGALPSIWTYGHRNPQGLEFNHEGQLWSTEMGQRGGDEVNLLQPGRNYGWPLVSLGLKYDGTPVDYGKELGIEVDMASIEQPLVDLTPSPAVSSFIFYEGKAFPNWNNNMLVGTLKARELYRMVVEDGKVVHREVLLKDFGRIRDIEMGPDGAVYLLLEHDSGSQVLRIVPAKG